MQARKGHDVRIFNEHEMLGRMGAVLAHVAAADNCRVPPTAPHIPLDSPGSHWVC